MKLYISAIVAFFGGWCVVNSMGPMPTRAEGYYTGCERPGAVANREQVMRHEEIYTSTYETPLLRLMPATGPTPEMKINAIRQQLYVENDLHHSRQSREWEEAARERQRKDDEKIERRASVR